MSDAVNKPAHYNQGSIECIEAMKIVLTPEEFRGYLKGNVFKYLWREKDKNGNEDLRKGKSYYDRLIELVDEYEKQKASDLQSLKDYPFGKLKQPAWAPKVGDWVLIKKPADTQASATSWWPSMDKYDGQIIQVKQIEEDGVVIEGWGFLFDWLEPAEQPAIKQSLNTEPPDGWRWLEVGEVIRNGDRYFKDHEWFGYDLWVGGKIRETDRPSVRRNRFNVGEIVVHVNGIEPCEVVGFDREKDKYWITSNGNEYAYESKWLAPYIKETK